MLALWSSGEPRASPQNDVEKVTRKERRFGQPNSRHAKIRNLENDMLGHQKLSFDTQKMFFPVHFKKSKTFLAEDFRTRPVILAV